MSEDTPVQQIYDNWGNRASLKEPDLVTEDERVFKVGGYSVSIPNDPAKPAKVSSLYNRWGQREDPMPNMSFSEGEMRIPIEDFVDLILRRVPADELAEGLWRDETVRDRFIYCMAERYAGPLEDEDRRKLLHRVQVQVYAKTIDRAIERLESDEQNLRSRTNHYRWEKAQLGHYRLVHERYVKTLYELETAGAIDKEEIAKRLELLTPPEKLEQYIEEGTDPSVRQSAGEQWREARDYWRKRLEEFFPEPTEADLAAEPTP